MALSRRALLTAAPAFIGCSRRDARSIHMIAPSMPALLQLPAVAAHELGYFREQGIEASLEDAASGVRGIESLLSGSADVLSILFDPIITMTAEHRGLRSFLLVETVPTTILAVSPLKRKSINAISDLRRANVAVNAPGSGTQLQLSYMLKRAGVDPQEISVIGIGSNAARLAALESGKVDAAVLGDPGATVLQRRHPDVLILVDTRTSEGTRKALGTDAYPGCVLAATESWLQDRPNEARAVAAAVLKAMRWIRETPPEQVTARIPRRYRTDDDKVYSECVRNLVPALSKDGIMPERLPQVVKEVLSTFDEKIRSAKIDPGLTYTNEYVPRP